MTRIKKCGSTLLITMLGMVVAVLVLEKSAPARQAVERKPMAMSVATTKNGNYLIYRMWDDGLIDVRLANPMITQAMEWPESDKFGISFQERWKILQYGD